MSRGAEELWDQQWQVDCAAVCEGCQPAWVHAGNHVGGASGRGLPQVRHRSETGRPSWADRAEMLDLFFLTWRRGAPRLSVDYVLSSPSCGSAARRGARGTSRARRLFGQPAPLLSRPRRTGACCGAAAAEAGAGAGAAAATGLLGGCCRVHVLVALRLSFIFGRQRLVSRPSLPFSMCQTSVCIYRNRPGRVRGVQV